MEIGLAETILNKFPNNDNNIYKGLFVKLLVRDRWKVYGENKFKSEFIMYAIFLFTLTINLAYFSKIRSVHHLS